MFFFVLCVIFCILLLIVVFGDLLRFFEFICDLV